MKKRNNIQYVVTYCEKCNRDTKHRIIGENINICELLCIECKLILGGDNVL